MVLLAGCDRHIPLAPVDLLVGTWKLVRDGDRLIISGSYSADGRVFRGQRVLERMKA